jgi:hypothetical protein
MPDKYHVAPPVGVSLHPCPWGNVGAIYSLRSEKMKTKSELTVAKWDEINCGEPINGIFDSAV